MEIAGTLLIIYMLYILPLIMFLVTVQFKKYGIIIKVLSAIGYILAYLFLPEMYTNILPTICIISIIIYWKNNTQTFKDYERYGFSLKNFSLIDAIKYVLVLYLIIIVVSNMSNILLNAIGVKLETQKIVNVLSNYNLMEYIITIPFTVLFAPIAEEFTFRFLIFNKLFGEALKSKIVFFMGAILISLIFAAVHFSIKAFAILFIISFYNCYIIEKKGYWYAVFNHMVINGITTTFLLLDKIL